jgi:hypothetical protein
MIRFWRGLLSTLTGLAFPLGNWWCARLTHLNNESRRQNGLIIVLPGIEGRSSLSINIAKGLADSGATFSIEIVDWTTGFWPFFIYHLRAHKRARRKAKEIGLRIQNYQEKYPQCPVYLIGQSGGGALAVFVLESLESHCSITGTFLLGPAISRRYDLTLALQRTKLGIWNFYSPLDLLFLTSGTTLLGTLDGWFSVSAGAWGFVPPSDAISEQMNLYQQHLHQVPYDPSMLASWHTGGHFGWANRVFVADWLGPILADHS